MEDKSMVVSIRNYQRIKKASFKFEPGLNVIVGPSNNGKSSSLRAITTALFNLSKDSHVTVGEAVSAVGIRYRGHDVVWKRDLNSASKNSYKIDGKVYNKLGRGQPQEVADALGIFEVDLDDTKERLNFQKQMAYPFLLDRTPSQVFKFMAQSAEEDNLMSIIDQMKTDQNSIAASIKANQAAMDSLKVALMREKDAFDKIKGKARVCQAIIQLDPLVKKFTELETGIKKVDDLESVRHLAKAEADEANKILPSLTKGLDTAGPLLEGTLKIEAFVVTMSSILDMVNRSKETMKDCEKSLEALTDLPSANVFTDMAQLWAIYAQGANAISEQNKYATEVCEGTRQIVVLNNTLTYAESLIRGIERQQESLKGLCELIISANYYQSRCVGYKEEVEEFKAQLDEVEAEMKLFDVCPYCGSDLRREEHGEH